MKVFLVVVIGLTGLAACRNNEQGSGAKESNPRLLYSESIPIDSANKMLASYLNSIDYENNDTSLQSIVFDADKLREYLDLNPQSSNITQLKVMFAHSLDYINEGNGNINAGYRSGALTLILAGYDAEGNYIYLPEDLVINKGMPCPTHCPPGDAGEPYLPAIITSP